MAIEFNKKDDQKKDNTYYKQIIKNTFGQYIHSEKVLTRAIRSCNNEQINNYLDKTLEEEPRWQNKFNIVYAIVYNKDLMNCRFCNKALPYSYVLENKFYCSDQCEQTDIKLKESQVPQTGYETAQKTQSFIDKIKGFFKRK